MQSSNIIFALLVLIISACSSQRGDTLTPIQTQRSGQTLTNVAPKYIDIAPSVSSDALKLSFVSGRNSGVLRVFTMSRTSVGSAFGSLTQLSTTTGLNTEDVAVISPDGNYILLEGNTATGRSLVLCNFAGTTCTAVTTTPWQVDHSFEFSPDSSLFYYLSGSKSSGASLNVASVAAPTTASTIGSTDHWLSAFWMPVASGYQIIAAETSTTIGKINLLASTFASSAAVASATPATLVSGLSNQAILDSGPKQTTGAAGSFIIENKLTASAAEMVTELGTAPADQQKKYPLLSNFHTYSATGTDNGRLTLAGFNVMQAYIGGDSDTIFSLNSIAARCNGEGSATLGSTFVVTSKASKSSIPIFLKRKNGANGQVPVIASNYCDRTIGADAASTDLGARYFTINAGATASAYTIAWVANSSADLNSTTADPEVFILDLFSGQSVISSASPNFVP